MKEVKLLPCHGENCNKLIPSTYKFCSFKCACSKGNYTGRYYDMEITFSEDEIKSMGG